MRLLTTGSPHTAPGEGSTGRRTADAPGTHTGFHSRISDNTLFLVWKGLSMAQSPTDGASSPKGTSGEVGGNRQHEPVYSRKREGGKSVPATHGELELHAQGHSPGPLKLVDLEASGDNRRQQIPLTSAPKVDLGVVPVLVGHLEDHRFRPHRPVKGTFSSAAGASLQ